MRYGMQLELKVLVHLNMGICSRTSCALRIRPETLLCAQLRLATGSAFCYGAVWAAAVIQKWGQRVATTVSAIPAGSIKSFCIVSL